MDGEAIDSSEKDRLILAHLFRNEHIETARSGGLNNYFNFPDILQEDCCSEVNSI